MNVNISKDKATVKQDVVDKIFDDYTTFSDKIEKEYTKHKSFANREDIIGTFVSLLKRTGMANVDDLTVEDMADKRQGVDRDDKLFQLIVSDFSYVFKKVKNASQYRLQDMFSDEKYVKLLS